MTLKRVIGMIIYCAFKDAFIILALLLLLGPILCVIPWLVTLLLLGYVSNVLRLSREWPGFRNWRLFEYLRECVFRFKPHFHSDAQRRLLFEDDKKGRKQGVMWALYPHGTISYTAIFFWSLNPKTAHVRPAVHSGGFFAPFFALFTAWLHCIHVTWEQMSSTLQEGGQLFLSPGGLSESWYDGDNYIKRKGFISIAMETRSILVPVWFPEERSYFTRIMWSWSHWSTQWFGFPIPVFFWGRTRLPFLPRTPPPNGESRLLFGESMDFSMRPFSEMSAEEARNYFYAELDALIAKSKQVSQPRE